MESSSFKYKWANRLANTLNYIMWNNEWKKGAAEGRVNKEFLQLAFGITDMQDEDQLAQVSKTIALPPQTVLDAEIVISSPKSPPKLKLPASIKTPESKAVSVASAITNFI